MSKKFPENCWVVVADGAQAALFRNEASDGSLSLVAETRISPNNLDNEGPSGKTPSEMSYADLDEATFAKQLCQQLNTMAEADEIKHLVVAADPVTLGQIRELMSKKLMDCIVDEQPKTLTTSTIKDIERSLTR